MVSVDSPKTILFVMVVFNNIILCGTWANWLRQISVDKKEIGISVPSIERLPNFGSRSPIRISINVDFPEPEAPTIPRYWYLRSWKLKLLSTGSRDPSYWKQRFESDNWEENEISLYEGFIILVTKTARRLYYINNTNNEVLLYQQQRQHHKVF